MVGHKRLRSVRAILEDVIRNNIEGGFGEFGVWRGGVCIFAKAVLSVFEDVKPGKKGRKVC
jgi:O-methyltransferase